MTEFFHGLAIILGLLLIWAAVSAVNATLNTLYYFIRDHHWSWKWWLQIFRETFPILTKPFFTSSSSSSRSSGSSSSRSSGNSKGFGGGSSRGGGSGRSF